MSDTIIVGKDTIDKKQINKTIDLLCTDIEKLKSGKRLGSGAYASVYEFCTSSNCNYVVKISRQRTNDRFDDPRDDNEFVKLVIKERLIEKCVSNTLSEYKLAPKVYAMRYCPKEKIFLTIMDNVKGVQVDDLLEKNKVSVRFLEKLISVLRILHLSGIYHGDLNPTNVFYDRGKFRFIDLTYAETGYKVYYDYLTLVYFIAQNYRKDIGINKTLKFVNMLVSAAQTDAKLLGVIEDKCLDDIIKLSSKLTDKTLRELAEYIKQNVYFEPNRCVTVYIGSPPQTYFDMIPNF